MEQPLSSVWTREKRPSKSPTLSRAQIVRAAMEILDAEGMEALSMRRLGTKLGAGATSIYWHVANKDDLLELVLDEVFSEVPSFDPEASGWRDAASAFAYGVRQALFAHPWSAVLIGTMPSIGPNAMRLSDGLMRTFAKAGFTGMGLDHAASTMMAYVLGTTLPEIAWRSVTRRSGLNEQDLVKAMTDIVTRAANDYPGLAARYSEYADLDQEALRAVNFDFGLTCFLDGLEARLKQR
ncbi:TetR/AcrR family transcriptional regulator C-terminal domain-containing protein [Streptosporangium sp. NPDC001559]|uniref:TetR/AcrR family transcriptional regulator C-terminal domain-containing protein n=1 Tax=Streptosporangium sp. NPDC001559 TaxID=3366187 RepID=UPI0036ECB130